ncbi:hypothetical protein TFKS16_1695 [Tannerella forsythia KS16]|jgi:hypothetical protein|uniref:Uncharacterized protein n=3 Tax=Tannerella forsythia TaxID=28112 RepID=G8UPM3_TANFA|nr:hypothetical protein [Tannerella forsythia]AEW20921.1 hypothetical protein BFO_1913 [Tannerella forsythia 92A2]KKY62067.1 hypothetical protein Tanf_04475 [Tannerella forsythia]OLQ21591.1 hypothetical protein BGK60_07460 [Tannerella forsythia]PDP43849.1 hypothetical protein CLI86_06405 [Tannerella forsythia]PDP70123.1 hypothetical protein CLI85_10740 [Tannerella forsythia]
MKVFVNDIEVDIFRGGRAKDAILKYYSQSGQRFKKRNLDIRDEWQNTIAEDSPMSENRKIYLKQAMSGNKKTT